MWPGAGPDSERALGGLRAGVEGSYCLQLLEAGDGLGLCWVLTQEAAGTGWQAERASTKAWSGAEKARLLDRQRIPCSLVQGAARVTAFSFLFLIFFLHLLINMCV